MYKADFIPKELDWVTERANCAAYKVFKQLQLEVENDVKLRQSRIDPQDSARRIAFRFDVLDEITFSVLRDGISGLLSMVQFRLDNERIVVRDGRNQIMMSATLTLNDAGECVLRITESPNETAKYSELRTWQFRLRALEPLFFDIHPIVG